MAKADFQGRSLVRQLADQAFSRASGAHLRPGNAVRLLKDAAENYPAWLDAIQAARRTIHVEMYIIHEDAAGEAFSAALQRKAADGVHVRLLYDWMGGVGKTSRRFWGRLRAGGVEVRRYNPPRVDRPLAWLSRDHRKMIAVDGRVAFVTGLCVGDAWVGDPSRGLDPWRDTGVELRGPAVADCEDAFAEAWAAAGGQLPLEERLAADTSMDAGDVPVRVVATVPNTAGLMRVDQLVAAIARRTLWLTDAYFAGTAPYVQALRAPALDGVDVRLLVPGASDIPLLRLLSRAGYRPLLEAGVRVFEWNGSMLHAKTAVADGQWARVGSTNLNIASWMGNRELDVIVEHHAFARDMESAFLADLGNATEIVLDERHRVRVPSRDRARHPRRGGGSSGRAVAGAVRIGNTVAAAITNRRVLEPVEAHIALLGGVLLAALAILGFLFPRAVAYPAAALAAWAAIALLYRAVSLEKRRPRWRHSMWWVVGWALVTVLGAAGTIVSFNSVRFGRHVAQEARAMAGVPGGTRPAARVPMANLPPPARRYLAKAVGPETRMIRAVHLRHGGSFRPSLDGRWLPIRGEQFFNADPPGFVWWGRVRLAPGVWIDARDRSVSGEGNMLVRFESTMTIGDSSGPELDQGALQRLLGEMAWFPTVLLDGRYVQWSAIDDRHATATLSVGGRTVSARFEFGADDLPARFLADRFRDAGGGQSVLTPFEGRLSEFRSVDGVLVPHRVVAAWRVDGRAVEYADFDVEDLAFEWGPSI